MYGTFVGIPINYEYEELNEVPVSEVVVSGEPASWTPEAKALFKESLVLTEDEQIFGIMREILLSQTYKVPLNCFYPLITVVFGYSLGHTLNNKLSLFSRPLMLRMIGYILVSLFAYGIYCFAVDFSACFYDRTVDEKLAELGEKWTKVGLSFYDKILKQNIAIRTVTGDNSIYSASGNINFLFRQKSLPLTARKDFFQEQLKKITTVPEAS